MHQVLTDRFHRWTSKAFFYLKSKLKSEAIICERATGKDVTEMWTFLPKDWKHRLNEWRCDFDKNFVFLYFANESFLLLNLVTRVQFWIKRKTIENEIKRNAPNVDEEGRPFIGDLSSRHITNMGKMKTGIHKIELPYQMEINGGGVFLGNFKNLKSNCNAFEI